MTVTDELNTIHTAAGQYDTALTARGKLETATIRLRDLVTEINAIVQTGSFDMLPNDTKLALNRWRNILSSAYDAITEDSEIVEAMNWKP